MRCPHFINFLITCLCIISQLIHLISICWCRINRRRISSWGQNRQYLFLILIFEESLQLVLVYTVFSRKDWFMFDFMLFLCILVFIFLSNHLIWLRFVALWFVLIYFNIQMIWIFSFASDWSTKKMVLLINIWILTFECCYFLRLKQLQSTTKYLAVDSDSFFSRTDIS